MLSASTFFLQRDQSPRDVIVILTSLTVLLSSHHDCGIVGLKSTFISTASSSISINSIDPYEKVFRFPLTTNSHTLKLEELVLRCRLEYIVDSMTIPLLLHPTYLPILLLLATLLLKQQAKKATKRYNMRHFRTSTYCGGRIPLSTFYWSFASRGITNHVLIRIDMGSMRTGAQQSVPPLCRQRPQLKLCVHAKINHTSPLWNNQPPPPTKGSGIIGLLIWPYLHLPYVWPQLTTPKLGANSPQLLAS